MKSIMRTITVIVLVNLAAGFVLAQDQSEIKPPRKVNPGSGERVPTIESIRIKLPQFVNPIVSGERVSTIETKVLVIPSTETKKEDLPAIIEDMNVMSRIFDKRHKRQPDSMGLLSNLRLGFGPSSSADSAPEAIYLAGYGCIFFMKVDFPLIAPPEMKTEKPQEGVDPVWEHTKRQMYGTRSGRNVHSIVTRWHGQYDAEQVRDLKKNLIKDLKHASNIRHLQPEEQVVLSVVGSVATPVMLEDYAAYDETMFRFRTRTREHPDAAEYYEAAVGLVDRSHPSRAVMTVRARKSDIDAFAKGELDFDKFSKQVEVVVLSSPAGSLANDGRNMSPSFGR